MTYVQGGYLPEVKGCSQDGALVFDQAQHDAWHKYLEQRLQGKPADLEIEQELDQTRQELSEADALSQGVSERAAAAVRYAEACRSYFQDLVVTPAERQAMMRELSDAGALWDRVR